MAGHDMEVTVTLTPLGRDELENHRVIRLNNDKKEIEIGRASRNTFKGLLAAKDNAWFDYPILSRTHAKFTVSPSQKQVYVLDCGSTHGTYVAKQRLKKGIEYAIRDSEIITFGSRVTSGTMTYPAKDFRVNAKWENRHHSLPSFKIAAPSHAFKVPEVFDESSPERSREGSIQIIDAHPRTFSVPSTDADSDSDSDDDASVEIASSMNGEGQQASAATTPEHGVAAKQSAPKDQESERAENEASSGKVRGLQLKGPSLPEILKPTHTGMSQQDPIDLEGDAPQKEDIPDSESEDDGPEILSTHQPSPKISASNQWKEPSLAPPTHQQPTMSEEAVEVEQEMKRIIHEVQARVSAEAEKEKANKRIASPEFSTKSVNGDTDGFDSADDDGFEQEDDFSDFGGEETDDMSDKSLAPSIAAGPSYPTFAEIKKAPEPFKMPQMPTDQTVNPSHVSTSISDPIDVSRPTFLGFGAPPRRAPSPSDAALARKSSDLKVKLRPKLSLSRHQNGFGTSWDEPRNGPMDMNQSGFGNHSFGYGDYEPTPYPHMGVGNAFPKSYEQGPFSNHANQFASNFGSAYAPNDGPFGNRAFPYTYLNDVPDLPTYTSYPDIEEDARYAAKLQAEEDKLASAGPVPITTSHSSNLQARNNNSEGQSSKINISSLVNDSHADGPRSLKRKADGISTMTNAEEVFVAPPTVKPTEDESPRLVASYAYDDLDNEQGTIFPDAQRRDNNTPAEATPLTQDTPPASNAQVAVKQTPVESQQIEEPARKKVRTSKKSTSSQGIGKFVSGVCVGLVGAFAAFVATIPASVREEALRELSNAA